MGTTDQAKDRPLHDLLRLFVPLFVALSLVAAQLVPFMHPASADEPSAPWDIDGAEADGKATLLEDACNAGSNDDVTKNGANYKLDVIHQPTGGVLTTGNVTNATDLCKVWVDTEEVDGDIWLYLAFERHTSSGTQTIYFELNQADQPCEFDSNGNVANFDDCNPFSGRTDRDLIITFDTQGSLSKIDLGKRVFDASGPSWGPVIPFDDTNGEFEQSLRADGRFGEAAMNLSELGIIDRDAVECVTYANAIPMTITGNADTAEIKDIVVRDLGDFAISNCGQLRVTKISDPAGLGGKFDIDLYRDFEGDDEEEITSFSLAHNESDTFGTVDGEDLFAGDDYRLVEEDLPTGWSDDYDVACTLGVDGPSAMVGDDGDFRVEVNALTVCVVTNHADDATITVVKEIDEKDYLELPGASADDLLDTEDFDLFVGGGTALESGDSKDVPPGSPYVISETLEDGYSLESLSCDDEDETELAEGASTVSITPGPGEEITCTFVNKPVPPTLELVKALGDRAGGTLGVDDFELLIDGTPVDEYDDHPTTLGAGTYSVSETPVEGYTLAGISCDNDTSDTGVAALDVTLGLGDEVVCALTNDENAPTLEVVKDVSNDHGGTLGADDFDLYVAVGDDEPEAWEQGVPTPVLANESYEVSEDPVAGYMHTGTACYLLADGEPVGEDLGHPVTPALDQDVRCVVSNEDIPPGLTVNKIVSNTHGGTLGPGSFTITVTGGGDSVTLLGGGTFGNPQSNVQYSINETSVAGYEFVDASCTRADETEPFVTSTTLPVTLTLAPGEDVVCAITNRDTPPILTLEKELVDDANGGAQPGDFGFELIPQGGDTIEASDGDELTLRSNTDYTLTEQPFDGYELTGISCDNEEGTTEASLVVDFAPGEEVTCTFTNEALAPTLAVAKGVAGGPLSPSDFTILVNGEPFEQGEVNRQEMLADTVYEIGEEEVERYVLTSQVCLDADGNEIDQPLELQLGDDVTCSLINSYLDIGLEKSVMTADGDELVVGEVVEVDDALTLLVDEDSGPFVLTYGFVVTNTGEATLYNVALDDPMLGGPVTLEDDILEPGQSTSGTATYTVTGDDIAAGTIPNTATASGDSAPDDGESVTDTDGVEVEIAEVLAVVLEPAVTVDKTVVSGTTTDDEGNETVALSADETATIGYEFLVTNTGDDALVDLALEDDKIGDLTDALRDAATAAYGAPLLPVGGSVVVGAAYETTAADFAAGRVDNVVAVSGVGADSGTGVTAEDDATVGIVEVLAEVQTQPLPRTGADTLAILLLGLLTTAVGLAVLLIARRVRLE